MSKCIRVIYILIAIFQFGDESEKYLSKLLYHYRRNNTTRMQSSTSIKCHKDTIPDHTVLSQSNFQRTQMNILNPMGLIQSVSMHQIQHN